MPSPSRRPSWSGEFFIRRSVFRALIPLSPIPLLILLAPLVAQDAAGQGNQGNAPRRERPIALEVGTIHPVSGPVIKDGVIVMRRGRIFNVGKKGKVRIPRNSVVLSFPEGHAYPGLVDAMSAAYTNSKELVERSTNAGTDFFDALDDSDEESRKLIQYGITTAYVSNRSTATWRGLGAILRPSAKGFGSLKDKRHGGTHLRMTTGASSSHALDRLKKFDKTGNVFDSLEAYEKKQKDYIKALAEYAKKHKAYIAFHQKQNDTASKSPKGSPKSKSGPGDDKGKEKGKDGPKAAGKDGKDSKGATKGKAGSGENAGKGPTGSRPTGGSRRSDSGRRRGPTGSRRRGSRGAGSAGSSGDKGSSQAKGPTKPKWPKKVVKDPAKEALLKVVGGKLPLRVEVHRKDEIRAALFMVLMKELPGIILEFATEGGEIAEEIAQSGAPVVLTDLLPGRDNLTKNRDGSLPAKLHSAGVPVAIGSGTVRNARNLTLMAAFAAGKGLPVDAAVRALTLTPAEILGVADQIGSIEKNKLADVIITSGPLLLSDTRILRVFSGGKTQYESK